MARLMGQREKMALPWKPLESSPFTSSMNSRPNAAFIPSRFASSKVVSFPPERTQPSSSSLARITSKGRTAGQVSKKSPSSSRHTPRSILNTSIPRASGARAGSGARLCTSAWENWGIFPMTSAWEASSSSAPKRCRSSLGNPFIVIFLLLLPWRTVPPDDPCRNSGSLFLYYKRRADKRQEQRTLFDRKAAKASSFPCIPFESVLQ